MARLLSITSTFFGQLGKALLARFLSSIAPHRLLLTNYLFQQVRVVQHKRSKKLYALKYIDKARCLRQKAVANIIQERRLLEEVATLTWWLLNLSDNIPPD